VRAKEAVVNEGETLAGLATTPNYRYAEVVGEGQNLVDTWDAVTTWFTDNVPPATLLGVHLLGHTDQLVEIDADIVKGDEP